MLNELIHLMIYIYIKCKQKLNQQNDGDIALKFLNYYHWGEQRYT